MKKFYKYLLNGIKYFAMQSIGETIFIIILMYFGLPYSGMLVGGEPLWEVIIGILGYHAFFKLLIYGWVYLPLFVGINFYKGFHSELQFSIVNAVLSLLLPVLILFLRHLSIHEMENIFIATFITSGLIILFARNYDNKRSETTVLNL